MLVNTVAKEANLVSTEEEFNERLEKYAKQSGIEIEKIKAFYSKPDNRSRLRFQMTEEKVIELLLKDAKVKELPKDKLQPLK